jgi:hypothetical protein
LFGTLAHLAPAILTRLPAGLYYLVPQLGDIAAVLQRYMWLTDLADGLDAPLDNIVNANLFPLPQARRGDAIADRAHRPPHTLAYADSRPLVCARLCFGAATWEKGTAVKHDQTLTYPQDDDQLRGLIRRFTDDFCSESQATSSETVSCLPGCRWLLGQC